MKLACRSSVSAAVSLLLLRLLSCVSAAVDERTILLEFFEETGGNAWNENYGWVDASDDVCSWYGVICNAEDLADAENGRLRRERRLSRNLQDSQESQVLGIQLKSNFMTGRTTSSLWTLPSLTFVDLTDNPHLDVSFVGLQQSDASPLVTLKAPHTSTTSVTEISGVASTLQHLELSQNELNTKFPSDLFALTQLSVLKLAQCGLLGTIPQDIQKLSLLREVNLYDNDLSGTLPEELAKLVHLRHLTLSVNQLHGTVPSFMNNFLLLEELYLIYNDFTGSVPSLNLSPNLHKVYLNSNAFTGTIPTDFLAATIGGFQQNDILVDLANNQLSGPVPAELDALQDLTMVWLLGGNKFTNVSADMCDNFKWNNGAIQAFGCYGFMCPPETYSRHGYQTNDTACQPCESAEYFGTTACYEHDDYTVLADLYNTLNGPNWHVKTNWMTQNDICTWHGIECWDIEYTSTGRVRKLLLPNNGLTGSVPSTIYSLHDLTTIDFSRNDIVLPFTDIKESHHLFSVNIAGTKTKDFDGIQYATDFFYELYADHTPITGTFPSEVLKMGNVSILSFQECEISGEIPEGIFDLVNLNELYLSDNYLSGTIPNRWNELRYLEVLGLANNKLQGTLPSTFDTAASLMAVTLQDQISKGGGLTGAVHSLSTTTTLRTLLLGDNMFEGDLPENLLTSLEGEQPITVDLSNNFVTGKVHSAYTRFPRMNLYLPGNFISSIDTALCNQNGWMSGTVGEYGCDAILCPAGTAGSRKQYTGQQCQPCVSEADTTVTTVTTSYLGQSTCGVDQFANLTARDILELLYDSCGGVDWHAKDAWKTDISVCSWYGIDCDENGAVTSIQLGSNQLTGTFPTAIYQLPNLMHLKIFSNPITFSFVGIENAEKLVTLELDDTGLTSLSGIGKARTLLDLKLASNSLAGSLPDEITRLVNLKYLDISNNALTGNLLTKMSRFVSLTTLNAANNKFSGPVYNFATAANMIYLDLRNNHLTGEIPSDLLLSASATEKVVVDLSQNALTGTIPGGLSRLSKLALQAEGNKITAVDEDLCMVGGWNDYDVQEFGCDAILCPVGTWNRLGRQATETTPCADCKKAKYMGTTTCSSAAKYMQTLGWWSIAVVSWMLLA